MENYLINEAIKTVVLFVTAYSLGIWVKMRNIKVNNTRKIFHFTLFFLPVYLAANIPFQPSLYTTALSGIIFLACISTLSEPFRSRSKFLATAFAAVDRPEDRPYTLLWVSTQVLATYVVLIITLIVLSKYEKTTLIYITVLIAGIGDGIAEPVGVRFGKRKYQVKALFVERKYTRSIEGSLCVFLSGIIAIVLLREHLMGSQFLLALLIIPIAMTLAEAWSPHTWDGPFLYLTGGASTVFIIELSQVLENA